MKQIIIEQSFQMMLNAKDNIVRTKGTVDYFGLIFKAYSSFKYWAADFKIIGRTYQTQRYWKRDFLSFKMMSNVEVCVGNDIKDHLVPNSCHRQDWCIVDHVAQGHTQPGLQGWSMHSYSGQSAPMPYHPLSKKNST